MSKIITVAGMFINMLKLYMFISMFKSNMVRTKFGYKLSCSLRLQISLKKK